MGKLILLFGIMLAVVAVPKDLKALDTYLTYDELKAYEEKKQEEQWSTALVAYSKTLVGKRTGQCVLTLRNYFGVPRSEVQGAAKSTKINSQTGKVGHVIVFRNMSKWGHVGIQITPVRANGDFEYFAGNENGGRAVIKTINVKDRRISGFRIINYTNI